MKTACSACKSITIVLLGVFVLSGCIAALPALYGLSLATTAAGVGVAGFGVYKTVQLTTGGSAEVKFTSSEIPPEHKALLSDIKSIAIWPGGEAVQLAEVLESSGHFNVVTPAKMRATLEKLGVSPESLKDMTQKERQKVYQEVLQREIADALINSVSLGAGSDLNIWSFRRGNITYKAQVHIYSRQKDGFIWNETLEAIINLGGSVPNEGEMKRAVVTTLAEKILEVTGKSGEKLMALSSGELVTNQASSEAVQPPVKEVKAVHLIVTVKAANLRAQGLANALVVGRAAEGENLLMLERAEGWYKARLSSGQEGWIAAQLVREEEVLKQVPPTPAGTVIPAATKEKGPAITIEQRLEQLKSLWDKGLIPEEEYRERRQEILKEM